MLQWIVAGSPGNSGQTSRTLSHSVTTESKWLRAYRRRCLVVLAAMSMPRSAITRTALGCSAFGWLPALRAWIADAERCSSNASAICDRALLPVHRNRPAAPVRDGRGGVTTLGASRSAGCSAAAAVAEEGAAAVEVHAVVGVAAVEGASP